MEATLFKKRSMTYGVALFICAVFSLATISIASGRPFRTGKVPGRFGCAACHLASRGGGERNLFGKDYERIAIQPAKNTPKSWGHWILMGTDSPMIRNSPLGHIPDTPIRNRKLPLSDNFIGPREKTS